MNKDKLLAMFVSDDDLRTAMLKPFIYRGDTYATDGHSLIRFLGVDERYGENELMVSTVFPEHVAPVEITTASLREKVFAVPQIQEMIKCPDCNGDGEKKCDNCGFTNDCETCNGDGEVIGKKGKMILDDSASIVLDGVHFYLRIFKKLVAVADEMNVKSVLRMSDANALRANEFLVGDVTVLLMPHRVED